MHTTRGMIFLWFGFQIKLRQYFSHAVLCFCYLAVVTRGCITILVRRLGDCKKLILLSYHCGSLSSVVAISKWQIILSHGRYDLHTFCNRLCGKSPRSAYLCWLLPIVVGVGGRHPNRMTIRRVQRVAEANNIMLLQIISLLWCDLTQWCGNAYVLCIWQGVRCCSWLTQLCWIVK